MSQEQVQCPSCKSYKVESVKSAAITFGIGCIVASLFSSYFFSINYWIVACFIILGMICIVNGVKSADDYTCKSCAYKFKKQV